MASTNNTPNKPGEGHLSTDSINDSSERSNRVTALLRRLSAGVGANRMHDTAGLPKKPKPPVTRWIC